MEICSECGGSLMRSIYAVKSNGESSRGKIECLDCGRSKTWHIPGIPPTIIDMSEEDENQ